jgi:hypothetical protein
MGGLTNVLQFIGGADSGLTGARALLAKNKIDIANAEAQIRHLRDGMAKIDENLARFEEGKSRLAAEVGAAASHLVALARAAADWTIGQVAGQKVHSAAMRLGDSAVEVAVLETARSNIAGEVEAIEATLDELRVMTRGLAIDAAAESASVFYENLEASVRSAARWRRRVRERTSLKPD